MVENSHTRGSLHELNEGQDGSDRVGNLVFMQSAPPFYKSDRIHTLSSSKARLYAVTTSKALGEGILAEVEDWLGVSGYSWGLATYCMARGEVMGDT